MMISKELLSEVLGEDNYRIKMMDKNRDISCYLTEVFIPTTYGASMINIHELMYMCKGWALEQNIDSIYSGKEKVRDSNFIHTYKCSIQFKRSELPIYFIENTEPEAVFKACQWILEN